MFLDSFKQANIKSIDDDFIEILPLIPGGMRGVITCSWANLHLKSLVLTFHRSYLRLGNLQVAHQASS
jgi:hypothetical protein